MLKEAENRVKKELDIVKYIKLGKLVQTMRTNLFSSIEMYLLRN